MYIHIYTCIIEGFGLSAPGNELLKDASLKLAKGHRYGLLGPNGMGNLSISLSIYIYIYVLYVYALCIHIAYNTYICTCICTCICT